MKIASSLSQHVETGQAVVQALESIHRELAGSEPDLLALFVSQHHGAQFDAVARSLRDVWPKAQLIGCSAGRSKIKAERCHAGNLRTDRSGHGSGDRHTCICRKAGAGGCTKTSAGADAGAGR